MTVQNISVEYIRCHLVNIANKRQIKGETNEIAKRDLYLEYGNQH